MVRILLVVIVLAATASARPALATPMLIDNGSPAFPNTFTIESDLDETPGSIQQAADNFLLPAGKNVVTGMRWWGVFADTGGGLNPVGSGSVDNNTSSDFSIDFFANSGGFPDAHLATASILTFGVSEEVYVATDFFRYDVTFAPISLTPSADYWVSVTNNSTSNTQNWFWGFSAFGDGLGDSVVRTLSGTDPSISPPPGFSTFETLNNEAELAFGITADTSSSPIVPEPSSLALLGMGAFAFVGYGLRRRKQSEIIQS